MKFLISFLFLFLSLYAQDSQTPQKGEQDQQKVLESVSKAPKNHQEAIERFSPHNQKDRQHREQIKAINPSEMNALAQKCEDKKDMNACFELGMIFYQGRSAYGQNLQEAYYYLEQSCKADKSLGCYEGGIIAAHSREKLSTAFLLLEKACNSGDLRGCRNLATLYYNGSGVAKNHYKALGLYNSNCLKGDESSCQKLYYALGVAYEKSKNLVGAKIQYQKACSYGEKTSCNKLKSWGLQSSLKSQEQSPKQNPRKQENFRHNSKTAQQSL